MTKKNKILFISSSFPKNKGNNDGYFIYELATELSKQFNIHVLCPHSKDSKKTEQLEQLQIFRFQYFLKKHQHLTASNGILEGLKRNNFNYLLLPFFFCSQIYSIIKLIKKEQYDLIHIHWLIPQGISYFIAKQVLKNLPFIVTSHGSDINRLNHPLLVKLKYKIIKEASYFVTVSLSLKKICQTIYGISKSKIKTIPTGINEQIFVNLNKPRKNDFLFIGRLIDSKGILFLLECMKALSQQGRTSWTLSIVGHGTLEKNIIQFIRENKLENNISLLGSIEHNKLNQIYNQHKIFIAPALIPEGLGLTTIEAMACGCIPIVTDIPALNEVVINNYSGYTFPKKNKEALMTIMQYSLENYSQLQHITINAQAEVSKKYTWKAISHQYSNLYKNAIEQAQSTKTV